MAQPTTNEIKDALTASYGFLSGAAETLKISRSTLKRRISNTPSLTQHVDDLKEKKLDFAEGRLMQLMRDGNVAAIIFYLKTQGRERGYTERVEVGGDNEALTAFTTALAATRAERERAIN